MNNNAKDVIGGLRAVNFLLILLRIDRFDFPLDRAIHAMLVEFQSPFQQMLNLVSGLTNFGDAREELLSAIDDILDESARDFYSRDTLDLFLSLYEGRKRLIHPNYDDLVPLRSLLVDICRSKTHDLLRSIMWLRIAFFSSYLDVDLPSLKQDWKTFCSIVIDVGQVSFADEQYSLFVSSLRSWRFSDLVVAALEKSARGEMPYNAAFSNAIREVEDASN